MIEFLIKADGNLYYSLKLARIYSFGLLGFNICKIVVQYLELHFFAALKSLDLFVISAEMFDLFLVCNGILVKVLIFEARENSIRIYMRMKTVHISDWSETSMVETCLHDLQFCLNLQYKLHFIWICNFSIWMFILSIFFNVYSDDFKF